MNENVVREFHIIVKSPTNGDPLCCGWPENPEGMQDQVSVAWKFLFSDGNWYGDYVHAGKEASVETVAQAIQILLDQAMRTLKALREEDNEQD